MNRDGYSEHFRATLPDRRCTATNRHGEQCSRAPIVGGYVCSQHGGNAPLARRAARERLLMLVEPALEVLHRATRSEPPCPHCGRSDSDRDPTAVKAAIAILDRTGHHPTLAAELPPQPTAADYRAWIPQDRMDTLNAWLAEARAACERNDPLPGEVARVVEAEDAVLVDAATDSAPGGAVPGEGATPDKEDVTQ